MTKVDLFSDSQLPRDVLVGVERAVWRLVKQGLRSRQHAQVRRGDLGLDDLGLDDLRLEDFGLVICKHQLPEVK